jgi:hypothetical protein
MSGAQAPQRTTPTAMERKDVPRMPDERLYGTKMRG